VLSGYNADYLSRLCREKKIASSQVGRTWLIERASLEIFMEAQVDRKIELAENLARERELEYRKANTTVAHVSKATDGLERKMREAASSMLGALTVVLIPRSMPMISGQAFAAGITAVILGASVTLAGSGVMARAGEMILASAFEVRAHVLESMFSSSSFALAKTEEFSKIAEGEIEKIDAALIDAVDTQVASLPITLREVMEETHEPVAMTELAYARAKEISEQYPEPLTFAQVASQVEYSARHPQEVLATVAREMMLAYKLVGAYALNDIETVLALHAQGIETAANGLLSISATTRDFARRAPLAVGNVFVNASAATLSSYERGIYAYVENVEGVPSVVVSTVYGLGEGIGGSVAMGVQSGPVVYEETVIAFVENSASAGSMISEGSLAFGQEANNTVSGLLEAEDRAIAQSVDAAKLALSTVGNGAASTAVAIESVPSIATDTVLGLAGGIALRIETADTSMLSASPLAALDIDRFIPGFLRNVTAILARAAGSAFHGIFGPLAGFFGASEEVGLAIIPNDGGSFVGPENATGTEEAVKGNTTVYNGPVTIVRNEYPTVNYGGVPQTYVDERIELLRRTLYNRIEDVADQTTFRGDIHDSSITDSSITDSTFANGVITDSTFTGGSINGSTLDVATTTITGSLTVTGETSTNGFVSVNSTSTNATSTNFFATNAFLTNLLGSNATITNATSTNFYAAVAAVVDGFFTNLTATLATITNAVIANLTATNATLTNATSTNATSTNLFATNLNSTNATSTNFFASSARITTGIIDALTSPLANITTAVITNLTATNSTLTNATSTNSFALAYVTPSRLLSVGANGVATSTTLSSWVTGTLNQLTVTDNGIGGITLSLPSLITIGTSQPTTIASNGATSTFGGGIQASIIEGGQYIAGPYVLATSTTATSAFSGNIAVGRNATFGTSAADFLTVNSSISSNLIPSANNTYDLGSVGNNWNRIYVDEVVANNISAASTSISGTVSESFSINSDNATADTENSTLVFNRGSASPNALLTWNSTLDRFEFNMPVFSASGLFTSATTTNFETTNFRLNSNTFTSLLGTGLSNVSGALTVNYSDLATDFFRQGGNSFGTTATLGTNDAQSLAFETNGTTKMTILSGGNVGIGTSTPDAKLQVNGSAYIGAVGTQGQARFYSNSSSGTGAYGYIQASNTSLGQLDFVAGQGSAAVINRFSFGASVTPQTDATYDLGSAGVGWRSIWVSGTNNNYFGGNVGIGTTSPYAKLSVKGAGTTTGVNFQTTNSSDTPLFTVLDSGNVGIGTAAPGSLLQVGAFNTTGNTSYVTIDAAASSQAGFNIRSAGGNTAQIYRPANTTDLRIYGQTLGADIITFKTNTGNVGIGTTTPGAKLDVFGNLNIGTGAANSVLSFNDANSANYYRTITDTGTGLQISNSEGGGTVLALTGLSGGTEYFTTTNVDIINFNAGQFYLQQSNGNIGIGTTSPAYKLDVSGDVNVAQGQAYRYNGLPFSMASTTLFNYFSGNSGNLTATGANNSGFGLNALVALTSGAQNTGIGTGALTGVTSGSFNTAVGYFAGGSANQTETAAFGRFTLANNTGSYNTGVGNTALNGNTSGGGNVGIGKDAGRANTTGNFNTFIGYNAGYTDGTIATPNNLQNASAFGYNAQVAASNSLILGGTGSFAVNVGIGTTSPYAKLSVAGQTVSEYFTATSTTATSTFPNLSLTNFGIGGSSFSSLLGNGLTNVGGTLTVSTTSLSSGFFQQGGNSFGATAVLGTNDANNLEFETGGSTKMTILSGGNVGIGTSTPSEVLSVAGNIITSVVDGGGLKIGSGLRFGVDNTTQATLAYGLSGGFRIVDPVNGKVPFTIVQNPLNGAMSIGANGVGFATTSPAAYVHVDAAGSGRQGVRISSTIVTSGTHQLLLEDTDQADGSTPFWHAYSNNGNFSIASANRSVLSPTGAAVRLTIDGSGNVGVGSTTPSGKLSVEGTGSLSGLVLGNSGTSYSQIYNAAGILTIQQSASGSTLTETFDRAANGWRLTNSTTGITGSFYQVSMIGSASSGVQQGFSVTPNWSQSGTAGYSAFVVNPTETSIGSGARNIADFQLGGTSRMVITSAGSVGIGTATPTAGYEMDLVSTSGNADVRLASNDSKTLLFNVQTGTGAALINSTNALSLQSSGGSVGVGTTSPASLLSVAGNGYFTGNVGIGVANPSSYALQVVGQTRFQNTGAAEYLDVLTTDANNTYLRFATSNTSRFVVGVDAGDSNKFKIGTSNDFTTTRLTIDGSGNVGIGTTTPGNILSLVKSDATSYSATASDGQATIGSTLLVANSAASNNNITQILFNNRTVTGNSLARIVSTAEGVSAGSSILAFVTGSGGVFDERMRISPTGNVGIGSTTPYAKLSVKGAGVGTGVNFQTTNSSDLPILTVLDSGNVGIGSSTPSEKLVVTSGNIRVNNVVAGQGIYADNTLSNMFSFTRQNTVATGDLSITGFGGIGLTGGHSTYGSGVASGYHMYVTSAGNVGIGTTTPANKLDVQGNILLGTGAASAILKFVDGNSWNYYRSITDTGSVLQIADTESGGGLSLRTPNDGSNAFTLQAADGESAISWNDSTNVLSLMSSGGNVGIGAISPSYKLDVAGFINTDQFSGYKQNGATILVASSTNFSTLVGDGAGRLLDATGLRSTAVGYNALYNATSSDNNTAVGYYALRVTTSGESNTVVGAQSLQANTTGSYNVAFGDEVLLANTTGSFNTAIGSNAMRNANTGSRNFGLGYAALNVNTGNDNLGIGYLALANNTSGGVNTGIGYNAFGQNTTGSDNIGIGYTAALFNKTGTSNVAIGTAALYSNNSATSTVSIGYLAAYGSATYNSQGSVAIGYQAGRSFATGSDYNTLLGYKSGDGLTTGARNVLLGNSTISASFNQVTTGSNNIAIGNDVAVPSATASNQLVIGNLIYGTGLNGTGTTVSTGNIGIGTTSPSSLMHVAGSTGSTLNYILEPTGWSGLKHRVGVQYSGDTSVLSNNALLTSATAGTLDNTAQTGSALILGASGTLNYVQASAGSGSRTFTSAFYVNSAGNVGIGTTAPGNKLTIATAAATPIRSLDIGGSTTGFNYASISNTSGSLWWGVEGSSVGQIFASSLAYASLLGSSNSTALQLATNGTVRMTLDTSGNVGIGNTSPGARLDVVGGGVVVNTTGGAGTSIGRHINLGSVTTPTDWRTYTGNTTGAIQMENSATEGFVLVATQGAVVPRTQFITTGGYEIQVGATIGGSGTNAFQILSSGNVGIGTTTPYTKLQVNAASQTLGSTIPTGAFIITNTTGGAHALEFGSDATNLGYIQSRNINNTTPYQLLLNPSGGNVAIGTTSPSARFQVQSGTNLNAQLGNTAGSFTNSTYFTDLTTLYNALNLSRGSDGQFTESVFNYLSSAGVPNLGLASRGDIKLVSGASASNVLVLKELGNVGVGDSTPDAKLDILQSSDVEAQGFQISRSNDTDYTRMYKKSSLGTLNDPLVFSSNFATDVAAIGRDGSAYFAGNVGIGNSSPSYKLTVSETATDGIAGRFASAGTGTPFGIYASATGAGTVNTAGYFQASSAATNIGINVDVASGANNYAVYAGNTAKSYFAGNVGIGPTAPLSKLHVSATAAASMTLGSPTGVGLTISPTGGGYGLNIGANSDGKSWIQGGRVDGTATAYDISLQASGGNVGIGTTVPRAKLEAYDSNVLAAYVASTPSTWRVMQVRNFQRTNAGSGSGIAFQGDNVNGDTAPAGIVGISTNTSGGEMDLAFLTATGNVSLERMRILANGNVGIGTTSPVTQLHVASAASSATFTLDGATSNEARIRFATASSNKWEITGTTSGGNFGLYNFGRSAYDMFVLGANGNVGIGSTTPAAKFSIETATANDGIYLKGTSSATNPAFRLINDAGVFTNMFTVRSGGGTDAGKFFLQTNSGTTALVVDTSQRVGIGTTGPQNMFVVGGTQSGNAGLEVVPGSGIVLQAYNRSSPSYQSMSLDGSSIVSRPNGTTMLTINTSGASVANLVSCAGVQTNASGLMSCTSDERLKDVQSEFTTGLAGIRGITPQTYTWKEGTKYFDNGVEYSGFIAQNVGANIPEAMNEGPEGFKQISTTAILAASINAIKELDVRTLSLAPAAENREAYSLAVSADASIAGMLTVTGTGTFSDSLEAANVLTSGSVTAASFLTSTNETLPGEVLTGGSADLFKMASYAITNMQALSERTDLLATRIDDIDARLAALESGSAAEEVSGAVGLTVSTLKSVLATLGIYLENGVAQFETLVFRQLAVAKDTNGDSSAGSQSILAGNTVTEVENPYVLPTSKIFVTFTGPIQGAWYISNKEAGKFRVTLAEGQSSDVSFDYFILQTEGQLASPGAAGPTPTQNVPTPSPSNDPLPPVFPGEGSGTTTPVVGSGDTTPPSITLNGPAAREIDQGATWIDQGASASDETDGDLTSQIQVQGVVDTNTVGTYTVSYSVSDAAGNEAHVSRIVSVQAAPVAPPPAPEPAPEPAPAP